MSRYAVTLRQLERDVSRAGGELPSCELGAVDRDTLRSLVTKFMRLAPACEFPVSPEMRITADRGAFLLKASHGQVKLESWTAKTSVVNPTAEGVLSAIDGVEDLPQEERSVRSFSPEGASKLKVVALVVAIVIANGATVWQLMAPSSAKLPAALVPPSTPLPDELAQEALRRFAGRYATGSAVGDRVAIIAASGEVKWQTLGTGGKLAEEQVLQVQAVESNGQRGLKASNQGVMLFSDGGRTMVYFGDRYARQP